MKKISCSALCVLFIILACSLIPAYITGVRELLDAATLTEIDWSLTMTSGVLFTVSTAFLGVVIADVFITAYLAAKK
jgi:hypothetical protein